MQKAAHKKSATPRSYSDWDKYVIVTSRYWLFSVSVPDCPRLYNILMVLT